MVSSIFRYLTCFFTNCIQSIFIETFETYTHINTILAKANRMLAFLRRNSVMSFTTDHRKLLYLTFVRSYIGYASEVWAPSTIVSITKIESLQRRATKFILNKHWQEDISYHEHLSRLNLLPLTYWHEVKDLILYFKYRAGHYTLPIADYVKPKGTRLTRHSSCLLYTSPSPRDGLLSRMPSSA